MVCTITEAFKLIYESNLSIISGRICPITISSISLPDDVYKIQITSPNDLSLLLHAVIPKNLYETLEERLVNLQKSSLLDKNIVGVQLDVSNKLLQVESLVSEQRDLLKISLSSPTSSELTFHLLNKINAERTENIKQIQKNEELCDELKKKESEIESLKSQIKFQDNENQWLKQFITKYLKPNLDYSNCEIGSTTNSTIDNTKSATNIRNNDLSQSYDKSDSSSSTEIPRASIIKNNVITESSNNNLIKLETSPSQSSFNNQEVVVGVVQYITCQLCPEEEQKPTDINNLKEMEEHLWNKHVDKERKVCEACPSDEVQPNNIIKHMKIHTNSIYACQHCGKRGRKNYLRSHIRIHTGERPYKCETCSKSFTDSSTLRRHRLVHTGEKKFQCPVCGRLIARKDNVKVHIRSHGIQE